MKTVYKIAIALGNHTSEFEVKSAETVSGEPVEIAQIHLHDSVALTVTDPSGVTDTMKLVLSGNTLKNSVISVGTFKE